MATVQKNVDLVTKTQSFTLVKNMFRLAVSSICYLRNIFPEECFKKTSYGGQSVHQLQCAEMNDSGNIRVLNEDAFLLSQWLERSVFDALEKGYLHSMTFLVYNKDRATSEVTVIETYSFSVQYMTGDEPARINGAPVTLQNTKMQAIAFIRCLVEFATTLDVLPEDRWLTLKLTYYEDVTPIDYEPMFFSAATDFDSSKFSINKNAIKIRIGKIGTSDHRLSLTYMGFDPFLDDCIGYEPIYPQSLSTTLKDNDEGSIEASASSFLTPPPSSHLKDTPPPRGRTMSRKRKSTGTMPITIGTTAKTSPSLLTSTPVVDKVRQYLNLTGIANVRQCASTFSISEKKLLAIFATLVREGTLLRKAKGYIVTKKKTHANKPSDKEQRSRPRTRSMSRGLDTQAPSQSDDFIDDRRRNPVPEEAETGSQPTLMSESELQSLGDQGPKEEASSLCLSPLSDAEGEEHFSQSQGYRTSMIENPIHQRKSRVTQSQE